MPSPTENRRGILAMLGATALFMVSDVAIKLAAGALPAGQILGPRGILCLVLFGLIAALRGEFGRLAAAFRWPVLRRGLVEVMVATLFVTAIAGLPIANFTAIMQAVPLILTLLVVLLGLEIVGWRRWAGLAVGLAGVLLVVRPSAAGFGPPALLALASAALVAVRELITRRIGDDIPTMAIAFGTTAAVTTAGFALGLTEEWRPLTLQQWGYLSVSAVMVVGAGVLQILACRGVDLSVVMPYRYAIVIWGLVAGFVVWGEVPDGIALVGTALIVASGLYTMHRETVRRRLAAGRGEAP